MGVRLDGRERALLGTLAMIGGTIGTLRDPAYDIGRLDAIATRLGQAFDRAWRWLPPEAVGVQRQALRDAVGETSDVARRAILQKVLDAAE